MSRILFLLSLVVLATMAQAQTVSDVFDGETEIVWLGLDFTATKIIADNENWAGRDPIEMFEAWNQLMIDESAKYDVAAALHRDHVKPALEVTMDHNHRLNVTELFADVGSKKFKLEPEDVQYIVNAYNFKKYSGVGIMFVVEALDKSLVEGSFLITFINLNTKEVLFVERMTNAPGGFGVRNYWASCVYNILKKIKNTQYVMWYSKYSSSGK